MFSLMARMDAATEAQVHWLEELVSGRRRGWRADLWRAGLTALSVPYGWASGLRNRLYDFGLRPILRADAPVVSVGNLTLGGTGKTPAVEYIARFYGTLGRRPAILSRGYGSSGGPNDEAKMLRQNLPEVPHLQGANRYLLAKQAVASCGADVLILDDGFQHRRLHRDLDIVMLDATNPWGHGRLFPRGTLREPPSALRRAHLICLTRCDLVGGASLRELLEEIADLAPQAPTLTSCHEPLGLLSPSRSTNGSAALLGLDALRQRPVAAFCGIGNPEAFRRTLLRLGAELRAFQSFPDHHLYAKSDLEALRQWAAGLPRDALLVTTQKDLVKLPCSELSGRPLLALRVSLRITSGQETLDHLLKGVVQ